MALDRKKVHKPIRKLRKTLKKISTQPTPGETHDLRTNIRRLEATLSALSLDSDHAGKRVLKELSRIRKRAGKVRDMDVLTGYVAGVNPDGERDCQVQLLEHLGAKRAKAAKKLHVVIAVDRQSVRRHLQRTSDEIDRLLCENPDDDCDGHAASAEATATALTLQSELKSPKRLGRQNLHPYRLKVKELRNVLKMAEANSDEEFLNTLGEVKDAIGEWHDWEELLRIGKKVLDHGQSCGLIRTLKLTCDEKFQQALGRAETMRKNCLGAASGQRRPRSKQPVPRAIVAIAA